MIRFLPGCTLVISLIIVSVVAWYVLRALRVMP